MSDEPTKWHHPNCSFGATNGPAGDICNCNMVVSYPAYAALRATIEQQAQELVEANAHIHEQQVAYLDASDTFEFMKQQLAAMTTRFTETAKSFNEAIKREASVLQQLATSQARCAKFEAIVGDHQNGACNRTIAQLQATLADTTEELQREKARTWNDNVRFIAESRDFLLQQYCNLQIYYGEQKHEIRNLKATLAGRELRIRELDSIVLMRDTTLAAREERIRELEDQMNAKRYVTNETL